MLCRLVLLAALAYAQIPSLDDLGSDWIQYSTFQYESVVQLPTIAHFKGAVGLNSDLLSVTYRFPPVFNGRNANESVSYATMTVDGQTPTLMQHRWRAYEGARDSTVVNGIQVQTRTRMVYNDTAILQNITIVNNGSTNTSHTVSIVLSGIIGQNPMSEMWNTWGYCMDWAGCLNSTANFDFNVEEGMILINPAGGLAPRKRNYTFVNNTDSVGPDLGQAPTKNISQLKEICDNTIGCMGFNMNGWLKQQVIQDVKFPGCTLWGTTEAPFPGIMMSGFAFGGVQPNSLVVSSVGVATFNLDIPRGTSVTLRMVYATDMTSMSSLKSRLTDFAQGFDAYFAEAKTRWEFQWESAFTPNNPIFSGYMPTLSTPDAKISRVYYHSILTEICMMRTYNFTNPVVAPRIITTITGHMEGGPAQYYWDDSFTAYTSALLDPAAAKQKLRFILNGPLLNVAIDALSGQRGGPDYAFDRIALFTSLRTYLQVTQDLDFLYEEVNGLLISDWLQWLATYYLTLPRTVGPYLTDYGGWAGSFLEVIWNYIHTVPALQAANAYMLRSVADLRDQEGSFDLAEQLRYNASAIANATVAQLWVKGGGGVWGCLYPGNKTVPPHLVAVRHIIDFDYVGRNIPNDIPVEYKEEMIHFFENELKTIRGDWLRALSPLDPEAPVFREDHGSTGSYGAWPAYAIDTLSLIDTNFTRALDFLHGVEAPTHLGPIGQANGVINVPAGDNVQVPAYKTSDGGNSYLEACGGSFADIIIQTFFGFQPGWYPNINDPNVMLSRPTVNREFVGTLSDIRTPLGRATITSGPSGLSISVMDNTAEEVASAFKEPAPSPSAMHAPPQK